jgi:hypothetical protein
VRAGGVFGVAEVDGVGGDGDFQALAALATAVAGLEPVELLDGHSSSSFCSINFRDSEGDSAIARMIP